MDTIFVNTFIKVAFATFFLGVLFSPLYIGWMQFMVQLP